MDFSTDEHDAITELVNITMGRAAASLNDLLQATIHLSVPTVELTEPSEFSVALSNLQNDEFACVCQDFDDNLAGTAALILPPDSALKLIEVLVGDQYTPESLDSIRVGTLNEIGNIVINALMGVLANLLDQPLRFSLPYFAEGNPSKVLGLEPANSANTETAMLLIRTNFTVDAFKTCGSLLVIFRMGGLKRILAKATGIYDRLE